MDQQQEWDAEVKVRDLDEIVGLQADRAGEVIPRLESKAAKQALQGLAAWWKDHTPEGQRGAAPPWEGQAHD